MLKISCCLLTQTWREICDLRWHHTVKHDSVRVGWSETSHSVRRQTSSCQSSRSWAIYSPCATSYHATSRYNTIMLFIVPICICLCLCGVSAYRLKNIRACIFKKNFDEIWTDWSRLQLCNFSITKIGLDTSVSIWWISVEMSQWRELCRPWGRVYKILHFLRLSILELCQTVCIVWPFTHQL